MRNFILLIFGLLAAPLPGCPDRDADAPEDGEELYFEVIGSGQTGTLADSTEVIVRDSLEWAALSGRLKTVEPFKPVDFSQMMVVVAALPQSSGGYQVQFESVRLEDGRIVSSYTLVEPGSDCITTMALTIPFQVVAARKADGDAAFERRIERASCSP